MELKFCARILQNENMDAAYVEVPYDLWRSGRIRKLVFQKRKESGGNWRADDRQLQR